MVLEVLALLFPNPLTSTANPRGEGKGVRRISANPHRDQRLRPPIRPALQNSARQYRWAKAQGWAMPPEQAQLSAPPATWQCEQRN
jgi:hypothetical protein